MPYKQRLYKRRADLPEVLNRVIARLPIENTQKTGLRYVRRAGFIGTTIY